MWQSSLEARENGKTLLVRITYMGKRATVAKIIDGWRGDSQFQEFWRSLLSNIPFDAYFWETPPLTDKELGKPFECVFLDSHSLKISFPDPDPFSEHFNPESSSRGAAIFYSFKRDSLLIAPYPQVSGDAYTHLAAFSRKAPIKQSNQVWSALGETLRSQINEQPVWLSTAGLGVNWLHIRLDSKPKYYRFRPYSSPDFWIGRPD